MLFFSIQFKLLTQTQKLKKRKDKYKIKTEKND